MNSWLERRREKLEALQRRAEHVLRVSDNNKPSDRMMFLNGNAELIHELVSHVLYLGEESPEVLLAKLAEFPVVPGKTRVEVCGDEFGERLSFCVNDFGVEGETVPFEQIHVVAVMGYDPESGVLMFRGNNRIKIMRERLDQD